MPGRGKHRFPGRACCGLEDLRNQGLDGDRRKKSRSGGCMIVYIHAFPRRLVWVGLGGMEWDGMG